ncbi:hypothetical protein K3495_g7762 [Podosphaera aphanis]|nr:hypothetical protein K3495_g7762 [Podosphaera aphanis]
MPSNPLKPGPVKLLQCTHCSKKFSRTDHLKRHQLRHTGVKPYSCIFCSDGFTRSDNLRDHYPSCPQRQNRPIPEAARGGRRSHACDSCTAMKLGCDGKNPCNTCRQKKIECKFIRLQSKGLNVRANNINIHEAQSNRGSINFLLNGGNASFLDCFRFPATAERRNIVSYRNQQPTVLLNHFNGNGVVPLETDLTNWSMPENDRFLSFMSSPFASFPNEASPISNMVLTEWEPPNDQSSGIIQCILERAMMLNLSPHEIGVHLEFLFTPSKITRFVQNAFQLWHPNCPIIYLPSFCIETAPLPLLTVITIMGALYSKDDAEVNAARIILDLVEYYIFSLDDLTDEQEIRQMMRTGNIIESPFVFQNLQAAYIMVVLQFWTGNSISKKRAIESRFGNVVKIAHRLRLHRARHEQEDFLSEPIWIEKECQIRLINIICLFDCALSFFAQSPCRLVISEMEFDLMSDDRFFFSHQPFSEPGFMQSGRPTVFEALQSLFLEIPDHPENIEINPMGLISIDMLTLIHLLFVYAHTLTTMFTLPFRPLSSDSSTVQASTDLESDLDSNTSIMKSALKRWHAIWGSIRDSISPDEFANQHFLKNALNYWMVTQMIVMSPGNVDSIMRMDMSCEDFLGQC